MTQIPFDVTARFHKGAAPSREANLRTNKQGDIKRILEFMQTHPETYVKEIIRELGIPHQSASARLTDLKAAKVIEVIPDRREEGCGVVRLVTGQARLF